jgi:putative ABC transport system permease protein
VSTFLAGLRSRRWLNVGVFLLGVLAMVVAVATPLYARSSAEHLLDQRTEQRPVTETGLSVETAPQSPPRLEVDPAQDGEGKPEKQMVPLSQEERDQMLSQVTDLVTTDAANTYWLPPTTYLLSTGEYRTGAASYQINTYWRDGMCENADVEGSCPSAPGEALIDPTMLQTIDAKIGDEVTVVYTGFGGDDEPVVDYPQPYTIVGTYTIDDNASPSWFNPGHTGGDGSLRPPSLGSTTPPQAPALLVDQSSVTFNAATVAGADRPVDLDALDIATMDDAERQLATWQTSISAQGPPILQPDDVTSYEALFEEVRSEQELLSRVTLAAVVPLIVLALLLLFVLVASAAEVRRQEVALAKLRGFSTGKVVRFAIAEPAAVLLLTVPVGITLAVVGERVLAGIWLGPTPFVVTTQAVVSAVVVTATALLAAFVAVLGVVREPLAASLSSATRRRGTSTWSLLAQGALVMLSVVAVVQIITSDATQSSSFVELLAPLFVAIGASVVSLVLIGMLARLWMRRTADAGGLSPFLASRRLVRRQDLMQLVLPLLLATAMAAFAASSWKVADDWRVSKAAATIGASTVYYTDTAPARLQWVTQQVDPEGRYLAAAVPPAPRTVDGGRVALVDASRFARVAAWDSQWGTSGASEVQGWLTPPGEHDPIRFSGSHVRVELHDIGLHGKLNLPLEMWLRYVPDSNGDERLATLGSLPKKGSVTLEGFVSECADGCSVQQLYLSGSSSSVSDASGKVTIASIAADGDEPGDWRLDDPDAWRPALPFGDSGVSPVSLDAGPDGLALQISGEPAVVRLTTTDVPVAPPIVATGTTDLDPVGGYPADTVNGASVNGVRTPMELTGRAEALPMVGNNGGLSDLTAALREYGDQASNITITHLMVAAGTPRSVLEQVRKEGVSLTDSRSEAEELEELRSDAFSLGWRVFLLVGVLTLVLAFLGVLALAVVQLRWRSYEVAALRVVGVRRRDLRRAIVAEYVALLGMAVVGGALAAIASLLLVLPSLDIGAIGEFDPAVDFSLRWAVVAGVVAVVMVGVLVIALWISRRTVKQGTPATLRQADAR